MIKINDLEIRVTNAPPLSIVDEDSLERRSFIISPNHIDFDQNSKSYGSFSDIQTGVAAEWIVRLCQKRGGWFSFTLDEVDLFVRENGGDSFDFHGLIDYLYSEALSDGSRVDGGLIVLGADGRFRVTAEFVYLCYRAAYVPAAL